MSEQIGMFSESVQGPKGAGQKSGSGHRPLAYKARPQSLAEYFGQDEVLKRYAFLGQEHFPSLILFGPPGVGKTTLAHILGKQSDKEVYFFNAVLGGVKELKKLIDSAEEMKLHFQREAIIFIDEIHRFNKAQQDALLPYVERGSFTLIGATTENPRSSLNRALLSRVQIIKLQPLSHKALESIYRQTCQKFNIEVSALTLEFLADHSHGDARVGLNILDIVEQKQKSGHELSSEMIQKLILENARQYDKNQDRHYDVVSAFIKSMRGSDVNAALLWLAVMLDGGEDPVFIARRIMIFASEDIGLADSQALPLACAALMAVQNIGMPEARINLSHAVVYLAKAPKSNATYKAINQAMEYVESQETIPVPDHLKNHPPSGAPKYLYPHNYPQGKVQQNYTVKPIPEFYRQS